MSRMRKLRDSVPALDVGIELLGKSRTLAQNYLAKAR